MANTVKSKPVVVEVGAYVRSHGRRPGGHGAWAFCTVHPSRADYLDHVLWENDSYGNAKKKAVARAAAVGVSTLYVCS